MQINLDDGYQFGLGAFETIAVENREPQFLDWHLERLSEALEFLGIGHMPTTDQVHDYLETLPMGQMACKVMVSESNIAFSNRPNPYTEQSRARGFNLEISELRRNQTSPLMRHKTFNCGDLILEKRSCKLRGIDDVVMLNGLGQISECTVSNIFFVRDGRLVTPSVDCGLLPGIMRRAIMEKLDVEEAELSLDDLPGMDACFVTNSLMGVMPVNRIGDIRFEREGIPVFPTAERAD